jgi:hypothetical protein
VLSCPPQPWESFYLSGAGHQAPRPGNPTATLTPAPCPLPSAAPLQSQLASCMDDNQAAAQDAASQAASLSDCQDGRSTLSDELDRCQSDLEQRTGKQSQPWPLLIPFLEASIVRSWWLAPPLRFPACKPPVQAGRTAMLPGSLTAPAVLNPSLQATLPRTPMPSSPARSRPTTRQTTWRSATASWTAAGGAAACSKRDHQLLCCNLSDTLEL